VVEQPGLLFVIATLLPLASFVLLLLLGGLRWALRPHAVPGSGTESLFRALGGAVPGRGPAYVALAAIGLAFLCCATGFGIYLSEHAHNEEAVQDFEKQIRALEEKAHKRGADREALEKQVERLEDDIKIIEGRWAGSVLWAAVHPAQTDKTPDADTSTALRIGFRIDMLSAIMFVMVTFIATLIHLYSIGYMADELKSVVEDHQVHIDHGHLHRRGRFGRFFMYLSLFCFSMLNLLLADNLFQIFVSWELVGVCSFLLVGFYYERTSASNAANKAFITNRIGDAGFIIGLLILWTHVGTLNFQEIFQRIRAPQYDAHEKIERAHHFIRADRGAPIEGGYTMGLKALGEPGTDILLFPRHPDHLHFDDLPGGQIAAYSYPSKDDYGYLPYWMLVVAGLGIFLGCVGKSAQFPLQVWLPDAMEGPTPVSALIHAATMVAAGVYLVGRCYPLFAPEVLLTIAYTGAITLFVAATIAIVVTDIKKVLAYSTVSQLGYMMLAMGVGGWTAGQFHLLTHAFFKALLFLCSGSVIYGCHHEQDMLKMGGLFPKMRITAVTMLVGVLTIAGIPFFSGWYSKDSILAAALSFVSHPQYHEHFLLFLLPLLTAGITTFYMFRMWFMTFAGKPRDHHVYEHAHEPPWLLTLPLVLLAICSICIAWGWPLWEAEASWLEHQLHHSAHPSLLKDFGIIVEPEYVTTYHSLAGNLALGFVAIGIVFALSLYLFKVLDPADAAEQFPALHRFLLHKWYFDEIYSAIVVRPALTIAHWCRAFDTHVIDGVVNGLARGNLSLSRWSGRFDKGIVDGLVNLLADVSYNIGTWLRTWQTGYIRSYVLFLVLAAVGIWVVLSVMITGAPAGPPR
jgi:NADH-quinone oxidoreductase subunit L